MLSVRTINDLTPEWATNVLHAPVASVTPEVIGTGQLGRVVRLDLTYDGEPGPPSVVVKLASEDETSRRTGVAMGVYEVEVRFFREIASTVDISVPRCHLAEFDPDSGYFTLVFDDLSRTAHVGDMVRGGTPDQAALALAELAKLQAPRWNDRALEDLTWLADPGRTRMLFGVFAQSAQKYLADLADELTPAQVDLIERVANQPLEWLDSWTGPFVVQHGDFRLDNMLFGTTTPVTVVDWQTARLGPPLVDAAFYLGGCLSAEDRRAHEHDLLRDYHAALRAGGVTGYSWDQLWEDYRRYCLYGLYMAIGTYALVAQNDRGRALYVASGRQYTDLALDLETVAA